MQVRASKALQEAMDAGDEARLQEARSWHNALHVMLQPDAGFAPATCKAISVAQRAGVVASELVAARNVLNAVVSACASCPYQLFATATDVLPQPRPWEGRRQRSRA